MLRSKQDLLGFEESFDLLLEDRVGCGAGDFDAIRDAPAICANQIEARRAPKSKAGSCIPVGEDGLDVLFRIHARGE